MAKTTLKTFSKNFTLEAQKYATKTKVRELDEEPKGTFVAFVDDGDDSFDVSFNLSKSEEITNLSCDCKNGKLNCSHKFALLSFVSKNEKVKQVKIIKKKLTETEQLLQDLDQNQLLDWLAKTLKTNKTLETEFMLEFKHKAKQDYTETEINDLTRQAINAVVGKRKKLEKSELKGIVELWGKFHDPIFQIFITNPLKIDLIFMLEASVMEFIDAASCKSFNDFHKYSNKISTLIVEITSNLENVSAFSNLVMKLIDKISYKNNGYKLRFLEIINRIFLDADEHRKKIVAIVFLDFFDKQSKSINRQSDYLAEPLLNYLIDSDLFSSHYSKIKPITYQNKFNLLLIEKLLEINKNDLALKYAKAQITTNVAEEYNVPYLQILKNIYEKTNDNAGLYIVSSQLLPITFDLCDFKKISKSIPDLEAQKKFRTDMITKAKRKADKGDINAMRFCVNLSIDENKVSSILAYLSKYKRLGLYMPYMEQLIKNETTETLQILLLNYTDFSWGMNSFDILREEIHYAEILRLIKQHVDVNILKALQKKHIGERRWASPKSLYTYLMAHLAD